MIFHRNTHNYFFNQACGRVNSMTTETAALHTLQLIDCRHGANAVEDQRVVERHVLVRDDLHRTQEHSVSKSKNENAARSTLALTTSWEAMPPTIAAMEWISIAP